MATEIKTWQIIEGKLVTISSTLAELGRTEKNDLEYWIKSNPEILGNEIAIIGEQVYTRSGPLDFLGIDRFGNIVVIELKRGKLAREVLAQAIDYAANISTIEFNELNEICLKYSETTLEELLQSKFSDLDLSTVIFNQKQRILLVGFTIEDSLHRMIEWLSEKYDVSINAIILHYSRTNSGDEILSRTVMLPEEIEIEKASKKKGSIEMSNDPGTYDESDLREKLKRYFSFEQFGTIMRIRDYFIPLLLKNGTMTREQMKAEFIALKVCTPDKVGYYLANISTQFGYKFNDCLRQIISYEFPNNHWTKDNFSIRPEYRTLVTEILAELREDVEK